MEFPSFINSGSIIVLAFFLALIFSSPSYNGSCVLSAHGTTVWVICTYVYARMVSLKALSLSRVLPLALALFLYSFLFPGSVWATKRLSLSCPLVKCATFEVFYSILSFDEKKKAGIHTYINIYIQASADANWNVCGWRTYAPSLHTSFERALSGNVLCSFFFLEQSVFIMKALARKLRICI